METSSHGRIPTLDGIRAFSICLVLIAHSLGTGVLPTASPRAHILGDIGVRTFFVLSGFLITTLLLREHAKHGSISLRGFYLRRALRIFPACYAFLATVIALRAAGWLGASDADLAFAGTYTMNFHAQRAWSIGHLWSLAVEEQFYLLWPVTLVALGVRRALRVALAALAVAPFIRLATWYGWPALRPLADQMFPCVFDALATGCALAMVRTRLDSLPWVRRWLAARWFWAIPIACAASRLMTRPWIDLGITTTLANLGIALAIHRCVSRQDGAVRAVLEHPLAVRVGVLSYSLYLWQQLFLNHHSTAWINTFPVNIGFTFAAAALSHRLVEAPFLRLSEILRRRGAAVGSSTPRVDAGEGGATLQVLGPARETAS